MNACKIISLAPSYGLVSVGLNAGEVIDKLTILRIKQIRVADPAKLSHVHRELGVLQRAREELPFSEELRQLEEQLQDVNEQIWDVEDAVRAHERAGDFGDTFVQAARAVYRLNDQRARLKQRISEAAGSPWVEQKSHRLDACATAS